MYEPERIRRLKSGTPDEDDRDAARYLVDELKSTMIVGGRDPQGRHGTRYRELYTALQATTERMGIKWRLQHDSLGSFVAANGDVAQMPTLLRSTVIDPLFERLLENLDDPHALRLFEATEPARTGWAVVDDEIAELRAAGAAAVTGHDRAAVARLCREVFVSLANAAYDEARHGPLPQCKDGEGGGTVKLRIEQVIKTAARGGDLADLRGLMVKTLNFANSLQHHKEPDDVEAMVCADATIFVATALRRLTAGERN